MKTAELEGLRTFRHQVYSRFGRRRDARFELLDALLTAPSIETPTHLSLAPGCQRGWGSLYEALNAGTMDLAHLEALVATYPLASETTWYAVDASVWPRCDAETSPNAATPRIPTGIPMASRSWRAGTIPGWNY